MSSLTDHLFRTLAAVSPGSRLLDLECGDRTVTHALAALGFDLHATASRTEVAVRTQHAVATAFPALADRVITAAPRALGYPDHFFEWVVALGSYDAIEADRLGDALAETRRVLKPGGWVFVAVRDGADVSPDWLDERMQDAHFAIAERPKRDEGADGGVVRGIYRKVDRDVIG
ncbi:MAG: class I SAM-dependent methyltransferase [Bacteroidota bacterium]